MIKKLLEYDIKKMTRILIYLYICAVALAGITRIINIGDNIQVIAIIGSVFEGITYSLLCSVLVNTVIHILANFITSFYKDESYLTHTLPVTKGKLLLSKYIASLIVIFCSVIVCFVSLFIMLYSKTFAVGFTAFIKTALVSFDIPVWGAITLIIGIFFAQICAIMSMSFAAIIKANTYNEKRLFKGILWFFVYYFGAATCIILVAVLIFAIGGNITTLFAEKLTQTAFITVLVLCLVMYFAFAVLYYFISHKLFKKGVNVD